jgi:hypothetical protein
LIGLAYRGIDGADGKRRRRWSRAHRARHLRRGAVFKRLDIVARDRGAFIAKVDDPGNVWATVGS